jgi:hypothetical protein
MELGVGPVGVTAPHLELTRFSLEVILKDAKCTEGWLSGIRDSRESNNALKIHSTGSENFECYARSNFGAWMLPAFGSRLVEQWCRIHDYLPVQNCGRI